MGRRPLLARDGRPGIIFEVDFDGGRVHHETDGLGGAVGSSSRTRARRLA